MTFLLLGNFVLFAICAVCGKCFDLKVNPTALQGQRAEKTLVSTCLPVTGHASCEGIPWQLVFVSQPHPFQGSPLKRDPPPPGILSHATPRPQSPALPLRALPAPVYAGHTWLLLLKCPMVLSLSFFTFDTLLCSPSPSSKVPSAVRPSAPGAQMPPPGPQFILSSDSLLSRDRPKGGPLFGWHCVPHSHLLASSSSISATYA